MIRIFLFLIPFLFVVSNSISQNLVPNGNFEHFTKDAPDCPTKIKHLAGGWKLLFQSEEPNLGNSKKVHNYHMLITTCDTAKHYFNPNSGIACISEWGVIADFIRCSWHNLILFEVELLKPLEKNHQYYIELYVHAFYSNDSTGIIMKDDLEVYLTKKGFSNPKIEETFLKQNSTAPSNYKPQLTFFNNDSVKNFKKWRKISGIYAAKGGEKFFSIGSLHDDIRRLERNANYHYGFGYDDIVLIPYEEMNLSDSMFVAGKTLEIKNIFFDTNKSELLPESHIQLDKLIDILKNKSNLKMEISGHTDNTGTETTNQKLSQSRAQAVAGYLTKNGIAKNRIQTKGYGSKKPVAENNTETGKAKNRRVEFTILN